MAKFPAKSPATGGAATNHCFWYLICISCTFWLALLYCHYFNLRSPRRLFSPALPLLPADQCAGRYVFIHRMPSLFNSDTMSACRGPFAGGPCDVCYPSVNLGLGPALNFTSDSGGWFSTDQFSLDVIFHNRIKNYECLTQNSSVASAIFVPYYAGIDFARHQWGYNASIRDKLAVEMANWVAAQPEWARMGGKDHFFVAGRTTWDFMRTEEHVLWGNKLFLLRETTFMTVLTVESTPWDSNVLSVPYPTYYHPSTASEVQSWQKDVRTVERNWLFSFVGAARPEQNTSIRGQIIEQCRRSARCNFFDCQKNPEKCRKPESVINVFKQSLFCLQPRGDSSTRRSVFDAMVAGCVPVFFHPLTAYDQYKWHLPGRKESYSVMISEEKVRSGKASIEKVLSKYGKKEVRKMREEVVRMIPRLVYANPKAENKGFDDAVDVAVDGVLRRVAAIGREMGGERED